MTDHDDAGEKNPHLLAAQMFTVIEDDGPMTTRDLYLRFTHESWARFHSALADLERLRLISTKGPKITKVSDL
jgi:hypothetical protein